MVVENLLEHDNINNNNRTPTSSSSSPSSASYFFFYLLTYFLPTSPLSYALPAQIQSGQYITTIPIKVALAAIIACNNTLRHIFGALHLAIGPRSNRITFVVYTFRLLSFPFIRHQFRFLSDKLSTRLKDQKFLLFVVWHL